MIEKFHQLPPYGLCAAEKRELLAEELKELTQFHSTHCPEYARFLKAAGYDASKVRGAEDIPFFPVRMFKEYDLRSIGQDQVFKTMTSSGTTGQAVSRIYVDRETAMAQQKAMVRILNDYWGKKRLPMLVADTPSVVKDRKTFSARGAAVIGLDIVSRDTVFLLKDDMSLDTGAFEGFLEKYQGQRFILFGFTFLVWKYLYLEMKKRKEQPDLSGAFLMTGGGWKKLEAEAVSREKFKECMYERFHITHFLDHYGMVEQTGCIYAECEYGHLHASIYSDIIIRDHRDFSPCGAGQAGIIQAVSVLPRSYPGHSLLTEDEGLVLGEDDCPCGRKGKYIRVLGRIKSAELRGCSDTYADRC